MKRLILIFILAASTFAFSQSNDPLDYRVLATTKTSTMEKELNQAAEGGFRMEKAMGGRTGDQPVTTQRSAARRVVLETPRS